MPLSTCLNCGTALHGGTYCGNCGQRNVHARLTFRDLIEDVKVQLLEWDLPWLRTLQAMLLHPGQACREYIEGKRARYVNPLKYLLYLMTVGLIVLPLLPRRYGLEAFSLIEGGTVDPNATANVVHRIALLIVLFAPVMAMVFRPLYSRTKYTNAEVSCFILYAFANAMLISILLNICVEAFGHLILDIPVALSTAYFMFVLTKLGIIMLVVFGHTTYAAATFFNEAWYLSWAKIFAAYLLYGTVSTTAYLLTSPSANPTAAPDGATGGASKLVPLPWLVYEKTLLAGLDEEGDSLFNTSSGEYGSFLMSAGRTEAALYYLLRGIEDAASDPDRVRNLRYLLASAYLRRGQQDFALTVLNADAYAGDSLRIEAAIEGGEPEKILELAERVPGALELNTELARLWASGDMDAALQRVRLVAGTPESSGTQVLFAARWAARLGDAVLAWLLFEQLKGDNERALLWNSLWMPYFSEVRKLPAFKEFVRADGLADFWRTSGNWADSCRPLGDDDFECF